MSSLENIKRIEKHFNTLNPMDPWNPKFPFWTFLGIESGETAFSPSYRAEILTLKTRRNEETTVKF